MASHINLERSAVLTAAVNAEDELELEVRWMSSGETACWLRTSPKLNIAEIKAEVQEHAGIPVDEQRLFLSSGRELGGELGLSFLSDCISNPATAQTGALEQSENESTALAKALLLVRCVSDPLITNLGSFRTTQSYPEVPGGFYSIQWLSAGINGDIWKYKWDQGECSEFVAVKKLCNGRLARVWGTETDERTIHIDFKGKDSQREPPAEDSLTEIAILSHLSRQLDAPESLLKMHSVFMENDFTWLVTEYCDGGELFDVAARGAVPEHDLRRYSQDLFEAVSYLHAHHIGHRDISLENILLKGDTIKLMDFGMSVLSHSASGTPLHYFRAVGKDFYRAPECYVPKTAEVSVDVPSHAKAGDVILAQTVFRCDPYLCEVRLPTTLLPGDKICKAEVWGYTTAPADIWAVAICIFILGFQCPPWHWAMLDDSSFAYVHAVGDTGLEAALESWGKTPLSQEAMQLLKEMLTPDPTLRPSASACLQTAFFTDARTAASADEGTAVGCEKVGSA